MSQKAVIFNENAVRFCEVSLLAAGTEKPRTVAEELFTPAAKVITFR
jgi:hypothetical protein